MEEEERIFYESELDVFGERQEEGFPSFEPLPLLSNVSLDGPAADPSSNPPLLRAFNPLERLRDMPQQKQSEYLFMFSNHKRFNGIQHFFELGSQDKFNSEFLENIEDDALGNGGGGFELDKLFLGEERQDHREELKQSIAALGKRIEDSHQRTLQSVNINRTISPAFYEHFENFSLVAADSRFFQELEAGARAMIANCRKLKGPGIDLITSIHDFWMRSFKDFVNEIWRHSSKFTLNFFKKDQKEEGVLFREEGLESEGAEIRSESSNANTIGSKDKRKGWTADETEILEQILNSNVILSQSVLKRLATQFHRSVSSVSSKLQKLSKNRKGQDNPEESLLKKTIQILRLHPGGLTREAIVEKINENYEMGYGGQWEKSVGQLLSSRKEFLRLKSKHRLLHPHNYRMLALQDYDRSRLTFKDKVVQTFLHCPNAEADLKTLVDTYAALFGDCEEGVGEERKKSIEANVSKTLSRYDIFDREAKTLYLLNPLSKPERSMELELDSYFEM